MSEVKIVKMFYSVEEFMHSVAQGALRMQDGNAVIIHAKDYGTKMLLKIGDAMYTLNRIPYMNLVKRLDHESIRDELKYKDTVVRLVKKTEVETSWTSHDVYIDNESDQLAIFSSRYGIFVSSEHQIAEKILNICSKSAIKQMIINTMRYNAEVLYYDAELSAANIPIKKASMDIGDKPSIEDVKDCPMMVIYRGAQKELPSEDDYKLFKADNLSMINAVAKLYYVADDKLCTQHLKHIKHIIGDIEDDSCISCDCIAATTTCKYFGAFPNHIKSDNAIVAVSRTNDNVFYDIFEIPGISLKYALKNACTKEFQKKLKEVNEASNRLTIYR